MLQVSRDSNLKIPKKLENFNGTENSVEDIVAVKQAIATAENKRFNKKQIIENVEKDNELEQVNKLPFNANDLMVITVVKKLAACRRSIKYLWLECSEELLTNLRMYRSK